MCAPDSQEMPSTTVSCVRRTIGCSSHQQSNRQPMNSDYESGNVAWTCVLCCGLGTCRFAICSRLQRSTLGADEKTAESHRREDREHTSYIRRGCCGCANCGNQDHGQKQINASCSCHKNGVHRSDGKPHTLKHNRRKRETPAPSLTRCSGQTH